MRNILFSLVLACLMWPATFAEAANYSPVDGAFGHERPLRERNHIGPPRDDIGGGEYREALNNPDYALADGLLNATWAVLKKQLSDSEYARVLRDQRRWLSTGRDQAAQRYMDEMSEARAYARATMDRVHELTRRVGVVPKNGGYTGEHGTFRTRVNGGRVYVEGDASYKQNLCNYEAVGEVGNGWIKMTHEDFASFYVLFMPTGAEIFYNSGGVNQGCGAGVEFRGSYWRD